MPPKKPDMYNKLCQLWRALHPKDSGNKADAKVKSLYYDPYKQGLIDIDSVIHDLETQLQQQKLKKAKTKLSFFGFKQSAPSSGTPPSSLSVGLSDTPSGSSSGISVTSSSPSVSAGISVMPSGSSASISVTPNTSSSGISVTSSSPSAGISVTTSPSAGISATPSGSLAGSSSPSSESSINKARQTPAQEKLKKEINELRANIQHYQSIPNITLIIYQQLRKEQAALKEKEKKLHVLQQAAKRSQKWYNKKSACLKRAAADNPDDTELNRYSQAKVGRPSLEETQPGFINTLKEIVQLHLAGTDERRRSEVIRTVRTLDDLKKEIENHGFSLSRTGLYYHLLPKRPSSIEGRRHHATVPVRLIRAQNTRRSQHPDRDFCFQTHLMVKSMCKLFGSDCVAYLSVDDKARVPIGLTAANKQSPLMMMMEYIVRLADHDFVKAPQHKLIPSVNAICHINESGEVTYSGPTVITIRSGKHDSSSAYTHQKDLEKLLILYPQYRECAIFVVSVDGGPDENPRFPKTLAYGIKRFQELNLDAYVTLTHAPGNSAFNHVERRMAPLSKELAGVVLPHEYYGSHLDASGKTIDGDLERRNFQRAGNTLAEIWSNNVIDGHEVIAEYEDPPANPDEREDPDMDYNWAACHVQQSQYCLQIVRCEDRNCCSDWRTNWNSVFPDRFIPPPKMVEKSSKGPRIPSPPSEPVRKATWMSLSENLALQTNMSVPGSEMYRKVPFDMFCPSLVKKKEIPRRVCKKCGDYFPSVAALKRHSVFHRILIQEAEASNDELADHADEIIDAECDENPSDVFMEAPSE